MACCQATADTKPIERFMTKGKSQFACDPRVIRALRVRQIYKLALLAPRELILFIRDIYYS